MKKADLFEHIDKHHKKYTEAARYIAENPELGHQEHKAAARLVELLENQDFVVDAPFAGMATAFRATYTSPKPGPTIALLAEYDALPAIGHGCGHNLIGVMSVAAAVALRGAVDALGGGITVFGTPAEETDGAKVQLVKQGHFREIDAAMMLHPSSYHEKSGASMALDAIQFDFFGSTAHAASAPYNGVNALDAVVNTYVNISTLRQQLPGDVRVHGIISQGGEAANIIPDWAQAQYYIRARSREQLDSVRSKILDCARAGALASGCRVEISNYQTSYDNMVTNEKLSELFTDNLLSLGVSRDAIRSQLDHGSLDMGNVSRFVPAIHPYIKITEHPVNGHTREFAAAAVSSFALEAMVLGAKSLAATAWDILAQPSTIAAIKEEFIRLKE